MTFSFTKLVVPDLAAAEAFYGAVFGMKPVHRVGAGHGFALDEVILSGTGQPGGHSLALLQYRDRPCPPAGAAWTGFVVADLAATCAALTAQGGTIAEPIHENVEHGVRAALLADPFGHMIEAIELLRPRG
ncbi:MAG: VOC family protein [Sphingomonadales bacterium]|nr:VOC family protein [Sphingomonadales bacterium]